MLALGEETAVQAVFGSIVRCPGSSRLYCLGVSQAQNSKGSGIVRPQLRASQRVLPTLLFLLVSGSGFDVAACGETEIPVTSGQAAPALGNWPWNAILRMPGGGGDSSCSAILLAPKYLLTSASCLDE